MNNIRKDDVYNFSRFLFCSNECICKISWRFTINQKSFFRNLVAALFAFFYPIKK